MSALFGLMLFNLNITEKEMLTKRKILVCFPVAKVQAIEKSIPNE